MKKYRVNDLHNTSFVWLIASRLLACTMTVTLQCNVWCMHGKCLMPCRNFLIQMITAQPSNSWVEYHHIYSVETNMLVFNLVVQIPQVYYCISNSESQRFTAGKTVTTQITAVDFPSCLTPHEMIKFNSSLTIPKMWCNGTLKNLQHVSYESFNVKILCIVCRCAWLYRW